MSENELPHGIRGHKGLVGTAPHLGLRKEVAENIEGIRVYGDAKFRWLMAKMEEEEDRGRDGNSKYTHWLNKVESFDEDYYKEMRDYLKGLAHPALTGKEFSEEDRRVYGELAKFFDFLWGMIN